MRTFDGVWDRGVMNEIQKCFYTPKDVTLFVAFYRHRHWNIIITLGREEGERYQISLKNVMPVLYSFFFILLLLLFHFKILCDGRTVFFMRSIFFSKGQGAGKSEFLSLGGKFVFNRLRCDTAKFFVSYYFCNCLLTLTYFCCNIIFWINLILPRIVRVKQYCEPHVKFY